MCRLVAYVGEPIGLDEIVFGGEHSLYRQSWAPRELLSGSVNADGYGVAWYTDGRPARIGEVRPIWYDEEELRRTLSVLRSPLVLAALRNGTPGIPVDRSGLLPLVHERWAFVLNGFVPDFRSAHMRALRAPLPDDLHAELRGSSDSETLFLMTVAALRAGAAPAEALADTAHRVRARVGVDTAQMNMVLTDGATVAAIRTGTASETNSLYVHPRPPGASGGTLLASEPTHPGAGWEPIAAHGYLEIGPDGVRSRGLTLAK